MYRVCTSLAHTEANDTVLGLALPPVVAALRTHPGLAGLLSGSESPQRASKPRAGAGAMQRRRITKEELADTATAAAAVAAAVAQR